VTARVAVTSTRNAVLPSAPHAGAHAGPDRTIRRVDRAPGQ